MSRPAERPLKRWYLVVLGILFVVIVVVLVLVAIISPSQAVLTTLAGAAIPPVVYGVAAAIRYLRGRR